MLQLKKCKSCGFLVKGSGKCRITGHIKDPNDFCSKHNYNPAICARCNSYTLAPIIDHNQYYCQKCAELLTSCATCTLSAHCDFEENPSTTKKYLQTKTPFGIKTAKNPARIRETCEKNCKCYNQENECLRQFNIGCYRYEEKEGLKDANV